MRTGYKRGEINKSSFINSIKQGIQTPVNAAIGKYYDIKTKSAQSKMIQGYVSKQPSKIPTEKRTPSAVAHEKEYMDKQLRSKINKKNPSLLK